MAASGLQAMCDGCGQRVEVEDLFSFDCTCPACGGALALDDEVGFADEAPPSLAAPPGPRDIEEEELFSDRPTKSDTLLPMAPLHDLPTKADTEDDPYALAAQALDSSVSTSPARSGATSRHVTSRRTTQAITAYSEEDLAAPTSAPAGTSGALSASGVALLPGTPTDEPPLPSWDDTASKLRQPPPAAGDLDGLVEVFEVPAGGTAGRGSRTYEREEVLAQAGPAGELEAADTSPPAAPSAPTTSTDAFERGATTRVGRPTGALFGDQDLDWLALIDDNLPESDAADGDSKPRVVIRLPETAAPTDAADSEQVKQFEQAIRSLEAGGPGAIDSLLSGTAALSDTRNARRFRGESTQPMAAGQPATQPHKKPEEDTKGWEVDPAQSPLPARPPSGRAEQVKPRAGGGPKTVDSFRHEDLDAALVCARDASSPDSDRFRQLVQRIFHPNEGQAPRIVMVTSPRSGDGKTTVAANLAIAAAGRLPGRGAVLVDADPRGRGLLRSFGMFTRTEGLLEALRGGEGVSQDPRDHVLQFSLGALDVVPLGIPGSDAAELLASERMGTFLNRLKDGYPNAVIIVDASAVLHAADPLVLARSVDGVVLVARADRTARDDVRRAIEMLGPKRLLGLVLNDAAA